MGKSKENYGDLMGKYLAEKISGKKVVWAHPKKKKLKNLFSPIYVTIGSILANVTSNCIVWGSGIISKEYPVKRAAFLAVRGPYTREFLLDSGYDVPEVYGDPALLLPDYYNPKLEKKYKLAVVPHYNDYKALEEQYKSEKDILIIDLMTDDIEATTDLFLQSERVISSSLHGLIVAHAYGIPAIWTPFSDKLFGDGIKFKDYFASVDIPYYQMPIQKKKMTLADIDVLFREHPSLVELEKIKQLRVDLMEVCPFKG
ncbi:polysaccharide pyruvyl transferase [Ulvibacter antarcticus]|uniref:Polysaccharide pyruvyl transferase n=2 Tax=Ulvibacter antarcticus TaxID=442714 RepID=A0A3L9YB80_9FLAO|nr:polysaccharide pyruvyl transferase [Ulvibacter antarcticus]